jgi:hypothetical protein
MIVYCIQELRLMSKKRRNHQIHDRHRRPPMSLDRRQFVQSLALASLKISHQFPGGTLDRGRLSATGCAASSRPRSRSAATAR